MFAQIISSLVVLAFPINPGVLPEIKLTYSQFGGMSGPPDESGRTCYNVETLIIENGAARIVNNCSLASFGRAGEVTRNVTLPLDAARIALLFNLKSSFSSILLQKDLSNSISRSCDKLFRLDVSIENQKFSIEGYRHDNTLSRVVSLLLDQLDDAIIQIFPTWTVPS